MERNERSQKELLTMNDFINCFDCKKSLPRDKVLLKKEMGFLPDFLLDSNDNEEEILCGACILRLNGKDKFEFMKMIYDMNKK